MSIRLPHQLTQLDAGYACGACGGHWKGLPRGGCPARQQPSALERRRRPAPLCQHCAQRPASGGPLCRACQAADDAREQAKLAAMIARDQAGARTWAQQQLRKRPLCVATSGIADRDNHALVEVAAVTCEGETALNTLVRAALPLPRWAQLRYQLTPSQLRAAPSQPAVADDLAATLDREHVVSWGARYAATLIDDLLDTADCYAVTHGWTDLRPTYARHAGVWMPRAKRYRLLGLPGRGPLALQCARATLNALREMAGLEALRFPPAQRWRPIPLFDELDPDPDPDAWVE